MVVLGSAEHSSNSKEKSVLDILSKCLFYSCMYFYIHIHKTYIHI